MTLLTKPAIYRVVLLIFLFFPGKLVAQFSLTGEYRPRTEMSHGYGTLSAENQKASLFTSQRTRLNLAYNSEFIRTGLVLQDVRSWGNQQQLVENQERAVSLHEGWAEIRFSPVFSLKAGRQELNYDDHRILGNVGWAQQARSHDLFLLKYEKKLKLHIGIAHHENSNRRNNLYNGPDAYKDLQFIWFNKSWEKQTASLLLLNNGIPWMDIAEQKNRYSQTFGGRYTFSPDPVSVAANGYYQTGKDGVGTDISALNFLLELSVKTNNPATATFGYEYLSGNDSREYTKNKAFNPLYGTNHKFNGFMDYFYVGGQHINSAGLHDLWFRWACSRFKNIRWNLNIHYFGAAAKMPFPDAQQYLGSEVDWDLTWSVSQAAKISVGYSHMFAGKSMELLQPNGSHKATQNWAYLMISVTPAFIKQP